MAINLKKDKYNSNNTQPRTDGYYGPDGEFYPHGSTANTRSEHINEIRYPVGGAPDAEIYPGGQPASVKEIYPNGQPAQEVRTVDYAQPAYPNVQTVGNDLPYDMSGMNVGNMQGNTQITPAVKRKGPALPIVIGLVTAGVIGLTAFTIFSAVLGISEYEDEPLIEYHEDVYDTDYQNYEFAIGDISKIEVVDGNTDVRLCCTDDEYIEVFTSDIGENYIVNKKEDGTLLVEYDDAADSLIEDKSITIYIPREYTGEISINTSNSNVDIGDLVLSDITVNTSNGDLHVRDTVFKGNAELITANSTVYLSRSQFGPEAVISTSNSDINANDVVFGDNAEVTTSNGEINFWDSAFKNIKVETSNSDISVYAYGDLNDYTRKTSTSNASDTLGSGGSGEYTIICNNSNGDIRFEFTGEEPENPEPYYEAYNSEDYEFH